VASFLWAASGGNQAINLSAAWDESKHKRGQPENAGEFGSGGGTATQAPPSGSQDSAASNPNVIKTTKGTIKISPRGQAGAENESVENSAHAADYQQNGIRAKAFKSWFGDWE